MDIFSWMSGPSPVKNWDFRQKSLEDLLDLQHKLTADQEIILLERGDLFGGLGRSTFAENVTGIVYDEIQRRLDGGLITEGELAEAKSGIQARIREKAVEVFKVIRK